MRSFVVAVSVGGGGGDERAGILNLLWRSVLVVLWKLVGGISYTIRLGERITNGAIIRTGVGS